MKPIMRLPAVPLITNDPYFSVWSAADQLTDRDTTHWAGSEKPLRGHLTIDGAEYRFMGAGSAPAMTQVGLSVFPTRTVYTFEAAGVSLKVTFTSPLLLHDMELMGTPVTFIDFETCCADGGDHSAELHFSMSAAFCYDGDKAPRLIGDTYAQEGAKIAFIGQAKQTVLGHSGDHITIDWGYLNLASRQAAPEVCTKDGEICGLCVKYDLSRGPLTLATAYDDIMAINYFGQMRPAWWRRDGMTMPECLADHLSRHNELMVACTVFDENLIENARDVGGESYVELVCAAYRHTIAAHKLIEDEDGEAVLLSKENDSNGCIGTVDISYPSSPIFLLYNPELVNAMCRPVLKFAQMPVWPYDFAPHDVGRYPYATGQVYGLAGDTDGHKNGRRLENGDVYPPFYQYPAGTNVYAHKYQMPVEESGNMLIMLLAASRIGEDVGDIISPNLDLLRKWVAYLVTYGEDPGEQLCTDDFAGHLAHNVNLSAKAIMGVYAFAEICEDLGLAQEAEMYRFKAYKMAESWLERCDRGEYTALTFDGDGWSLKYNLIWDKLLGFGLFEDDVFEREVDSYIERQNTYGVPLDSRRDYTKSDWICWVASMTNDPDKLEALLEPMARYLSETQTRVPFSDWYDTKTGKYEHFIARAVQGGVFMPLLMDKFGAADGCDCDDDCCCGDDDCGDDCCCADDECDCDCAEDCGCEEEGGCGSSCACSCGDK